MSARVVLIDDDPCILRALRRVLTRHGFEVLAFTCPAEALAQLTALQPDVVVSDLWLPGITGDCVLAEAERLVPHARRVLISAVSDRPGARDTFIAKPWDEHALLAALAA